MHLYLLRVFFVLVAAQGIVVEVLEGPSVAPNDIGSAVLAEEDGEPYIVRLTGVGLGVIVEGKALG